jgi:hypothetical protein
MSWSRRHAWGAAESEAALPGVTSEPHRSEIEAGNTDLRARVEAAYEQGLPFFEQRLRTGAPADQAVAIEILAALAGRTGRLRRMLADLDADPALDRTDPLIADALDTARHYLEDN